jgi:hypothetical protein
MYTASVCCNITPCAENSSAAAAAAAAVDCNQASGLDVTKPEVAWTILAPTDYAFTDRLNKTLGITPAQLLTPANRPLLVQVGAQPV